jgi:cob(I)alamin adenosyltransferase
MKIYTKTGDDGTTGLIGGQRLRKSDPRIECYGTVDELNAALGLAVVVAPTPLTAPIRQVQNDLFVIGARLATPDEPGTPPDVPAALPPFHESRVNRLEMQIDAAELQLRPLRQFILPGGSEASARLHVARTVCRRAERLVVGFAQNCPVSPVIITYLNRLSDWLFVHARLANQLDGQADVPWEK